MSGFEMPPRPWELDDLLALGKRENTVYLKAVPILILEKWVEGGRQGRANLVRTSELARKLVSRGLAAEFRPKATSNVLGALRNIQSARNLTDPPLLERHKQGWFIVNLPRYEPLLERYRQEYGKDCPEVYKRLFPEGEPDWAPPGAPEERVESSKSGSISQECDTLDTVQRLLAQVGQAIRGLVEENQRLRAELATWREGGNLAFVHTSPDFADTVFSRKVTTLRDTVSNMLRRARHSIRISTRQMDMFEDELIELKRDNPELQITVLSRGPEKAEGPRKAIAGRAYDRMKKAGIQTPVEQDLLHSRMIVIDEREVLVSSADLDYTQMEKEFNAGIWTNDVGVVAEAMRYYDNLLGSPTVK